jgi:hypothetical protein
MLSPKDSQAPCEIPKACQGLQWVPYTQPKAWHMEPLRTLGYLLNESGEPRGLEPTTAPFTKSVGTGTGF